MKCPFCDFYTRPHRNPNENDEYARALLREIEDAERLGWSGPREIQSIYVGGGTPSLADSRNLALILRALASVGAWADPTEISLEVNPEDATYPNIQTWQNLGFNRFSLGVEALLDAQLERLGRAGRASDNDRAMEAFERAGATNLSVDLIFGLEHQTLEDWLETLAKVSRWPIQHLSCYNLTVEPKTRYWVERAQSRLSLPEESVQAEMFLQGKACLQERGFLHYEISNFAKPGYESKHNNAYWNGNAYWGLGVSAHSFQKLSSSSFKRFWHPRSYRAYVENPLGIDFETLPLEKHFAERLMLGLRKIQGVNLADLEKDLNLAAPASLTEELRALESEGFLEFPGDRHLKLTSKGLLFSDLVFERFF